jgi:predicted nucleic acid-binding protein
MPKQKLIYWDSCVFIHALEQTPRWADALRTILDAAREGQAAIVPSALTLAEVARCQEGASSASSGDGDTIERLFQNPYIIVRDVDRPTATRARGVVTRYGLKPPDAIHIATAIAAGVAQLQTCDGETKPRGILAKAQQLASEGLTVRLPSWPSQPRLITDDGERPD